MKVKEALHTGDDDIGAEADQEGRDDQLHSIDQEGAGAGGEGLHVADHIQDDGRVGDSQHDEHRRIDHGRLPVRSTEEDGDSEENDRAEHLICGSEQGPDILIAAQAEDIAEEERDQCRKYRIDQNLLER